MRDSFPYHCLADFIGNAAALLVALVSVGMRQNDMIAAVAPWGVSLSFATTVILLFTGWYDGELAYRYKIGMIESWGTTRFNGGAAHWARAADGTNGSQSVRPA